MQRSARTRNAPYELHALELIRDLKRDTVAQNQIGLHVDVRTDVITYVGTDIIAEACGDIISDAGAHVISNAISDTGSVLHADACADVIAYACRWH